MPTKETKNIGVIAVTGANGFIGSALCDLLESSGRTVRRITRDESADSNSLSIGDIGPSTNWQAALRNVDCVIHCAARAHVMSETAADAAAEFDKVNALGTNKLAEQAALAGVRRLIFLSSIGVLGNQTSVDIKFDHLSIPRPVEAYAESKWKAERLLHRVSNSTGMEIVIVRPPLVYGPRAPGNIGRILKLAQLGVPMPVGSIHKKRSYVSLNNLLRLLLICVDHPAAAGRTFLVSDGFDLSLPDLVAVLSTSIGKPTRVLAFPVSVLRVIGLVLGKSEEVEKMTRSLSVDSSYTSTTLGWTPESPRTTLLQR